MNSKKFCSLLIPGIKLYIAIIFCLDVIMLFYNYWISLIIFFILCYLLYYNAHNKNLKAKEMLEYIKDLQFDADSVTKDTLLKLPLPMVVLQFNGVIKWYNSKFAEIFEQDELFGTPIQSLIKDSQITKLIGNKEDVSVSLSHGDKTYQVVSNVVIDEVRTSNSMIILYFIDHTDLVNLQKEYMDNKSVEAIIMVDNYEEVMQNTNDAGRAQIFAEIDKKIADWASFTGGMLKRYERDKYVFIFHRKYLAELEAKKFHILDEIREINIGNKIPVTLSIGIGLDGKSLAENDAFARAAIDIALGRGGDQVVIKDGTKLRFIGGKTKEMERRTKVKARVVAFALRELVSQADKVIIMGHQNGDADSLGASVGLYRGIRSKGKEAYIVHSTANPTVQRLIKRLHTVDEFKNVFLTRTQALDMTTNKTLLIVVDTHRLSYVEFPELLKKTEQIVIIDHHRRAAEFIEPAVLVYHEPYASSTCEMVTEIIQYMDENIKLSTVEAEALYAGITMDTKNFIFKTGVRTFEAASFLRRAGVDTVSVKRLFQHNMQTFTTIARIVETAETVHGNIAVSVCTEDIADKHLIIAQAADELLNISGIVSSFVMCKADNEIIISGRSFGDINVQLILEKLGGGGHLTVAGAQLFGVSVEEAKKQLLQAIEEYYEEMPQK